jgi:hypothetical protein
MVEDEQKSRDEARESQAKAERNANKLSAELEEIRAHLEQVCSWLCHWLCPVRAPVVCEQVKKTYGQRFTNLLGEEENFRVVLTNLKNSLQKCMSVSILFPCPRQYCLILVVITSLELFENWSMTFSDACLFNVTSIR